MEESKNLLSSIIDDRDRTLEDGADPNSEAEANLTALIIAAGYTDNLSLVQRLLQAGADVNQRSPAGWNALMLAVRNSVSSAIVRTLLANGADPGAVTADGVTLLRKANCPTSPQNTDVERRKVHPTVPPKGEAFPGTVLRLSFRVLVIAPTEVGPGVASEVGRCVQDRLCPILSGAFKRQFRNQC